MENVVKSQVFAYNLECPAYDETMKLGIFNFFKTNQFTDVTLSAEGKFVRCHQVVLAAISPYFEKMFKPGGIGVNPVIVFGDIRFEDLLGLLRYIYMGKIAVLESDMARVIKAGQTLQVNGFENEIDKDSTFNEGFKLLEATSKAAHISQPSEMTTLTTQIMENNQAMENMATNVNLSSSQELNSVLQGELKTIEETIAPKSQNQATYNEKTSNDNFYNNNITFVSCLDSAQSNENVSRQQFKILTFEKLTVNSSNQGGKEKVAESSEQLDSCQPNTSLEQEPESVPINVTNFTLLYSEPCGFCGKVVEGSSDIGKKLKLHQKKCSKKPKNMGGLCFFCDKIVGKNRLEHHINTNHRAC